MPWFKVDDTFGFHAKAMSAGNAALGMWVRAGAWSASTLTGGKIPDHMIGSFGGKSQAAALVRAGLWEKVDGGYQYHDWHRYQPSRESVEADREAARVRQQRARDKAKQARGGASESVTHTVTSRKSHAVTNGVVTPLVTVPPTRPDPSLEKEPPTAGGETAQTLIGEWLSTLRSRPPHSVVGQVSKNVKAMLDEGITADVIRAALPLWQQKRLHPSVLASVVHEVQNSEPEESALPEWMR